MSYQQLTLKQRFQLETLIKTIPVKKDIALWIGVDPATISRELSRNNEGEYDARRADGLNRRRRKSAKRKTKKLLVDEFIHSYVEEKLKLSWSPEQIANRIRNDFGIIICHETIYQFIYAEEKDWRKYLRQRKGKYRRRHGTKEREKAREEDKKHTITYDNGTEFSEYEAIGREVEMEIYFANPYHSWVEGKLIAVQARM